MNNLPQIFNYDDGQQVRTVILDGQPWFVAKDVCNILGLTNVTETLNRLEEDEFSTTEVIDSIGRSQQIYIINEFGLYQIVMTSKKRAARDFKRWVTHDVLPSIRQNGFYMTTTQNETPELIEEVRVLRVKVESMITIASYEARYLQKTVAKRIYEIVGDPSVRSEAFRELHREIKDRFGVTSYHNIPKLEYQNALNYVKAWIPKKVPA